MCMITANLFGKMILRSSFYGILALTTLISCEGLEGDPDGGKTNVELLTAEVNVLANNTTVLNIKSMIKTSAPVRVAIAAQPEKGALTDLGDGLLQYVPTQSTGSNDALSLALFAEDGNLIKVETVGVQVKRDTANMPCSIYPVDDYVSVLRDGSVMINVLANDFICGEDSANLILSVWKPSANSVPDHGTAIVVNNQIVYTPQSSFTGNDKVIYRLTTADGGKVAFGVVYVQVKPDLCEVNLVDDFFTIGIDSIRTDSTLLRVYNNDIFCDVTMNQYIISKWPRHGVATINEYGVGYKFTDPDTTRILYDTLGYQVCSTVRCYWAQVLIELKP